MVKLSWLFVVLVACGSSRPAVNTTPQESQSCERELATCEATSARQCTYEIELRRERDAFKDEADQWRELADMQSWQLKKLQKKMGECNMLNDVYDSIMLNDNYCTKEIGDEGTIPVSD